MLPGLPVHPVVTAGQHNESRRFAKKHLALRGGLVRLQGTVLDRRVFTVYITSSVMRKSVTEQHLFKYCRINDRTENLISGSQLWFSAPIKLNDPFECRPWLEFEHTDQQLVEGLARQLRRQNTLLTAHAATANAVAIFLEGRHRNPEMWNTLRDDIIARLTNEVGMLCLSEHNDSILMWSHYGADHTGLCLGFEATPYTEFFGAAQKVSYSDKLPHIQSFNMHPEDQVDKIFLTKYSGWSYEDEWRIIDHDNGPGLRSYPSELLKSITFGLRTEKEHRAQVRFWAATRGYDVQFLECVRSDHHFNIEVREAR